MNSKTKDKNVRDIVLTMLIKTLEEGRFSHLAAQEVLSGEQLSRQDHLFAVRLFHGVLEQVIFLDWIISSYSSVKLNKMKPVIRNILRMSIYQMLFMDSVPDHAAVNEAARLTKERGLRGLAPFVNGILRSFQRGGIRPGMPEHVKHAAPAWLYELEVRELGKKRADRFFDAVSAPSEGLYARLLLSSASRQEILEMLKADGCETEEIPGRKEAVILRGAGSLSGLTAFQKGLIYFQDLSSMQVGWKAAELFGDEAPSRILDVCAAPGGKSLHLAELFPEAEILARDLSPEKVQRIRENAERCRKNNIRAEVWDALDFDRTSEKTADLVIADLPCSGLGVIGRKPDIRLRVKEEDLEELALLQRRILAAVQGYVRDGGFLIYSTCTVNRMENGENAQWFAKEFPFRQIFERQTVPGEDPCDGFYLSCFQRTEEEENAEKNG